MKKFFGLTVCLALITGFPAFSASFQKGYNAYLKDDYATALREFRPLAKKNNWDAQYYLAVMYADGKGVPQDKIIGYMWASIAVLNGDTSSQVMKDVIAFGMAPEQIEKAEKLAKECIANEYKGC